MNNSTQLNTKMNCLIKPVSNPYRQATCSESATNLVYGTTELMVLLLAHQADASLTDHKVQHCKAEHWMAVPDEKYKVQHQSV